MYFSEYKHFAEAEEKCELSLIVLVFRLFAINSVIALPNNHFSSSCYMHVKQIFVNMLFL